MIKVPGAAKPADLSISMPRTGGGRERSLLGGVVCVLVGLGYLRGADPHDPFTPMPVCPTKRVTGLDCPACGGLRLVYDLLHGDLRAARRDNPFLLICSPLLVYLLVRQAGARRQGEPAPIPPALAYGLSGSALTWMILRNLPAWPLKPTMLRSVKRLA